LGFCFVSDADTLRIAQLVADFLFALTLLLLAVVLLMRGALLLRERRKKKFRAVWQPILVDALVNVDDIPTSDLPRLAHRDLSEFLFLWNHLQESLLDESKDHLNQIGTALNIQSAALRLLRRGNLRGRLLAIVTLGQLRERAAWDQLLTIAQRGGALLSVAAARALVMIDPARAVPELIPLLMTREDWPASRVAKMLQIAGADVISDQIANAALKSALAESAPTANVDGQPVANNPARMVRYLELAYNVPALRATRTIVELSHDPEVLAACLRLLKSAEDLPVVRKCLSHEDVRVRVQAAAALGRLGEDDDEDRLVPLLSDKEWWVRYRAAQALSRLPHMREPKLKTIQAAQSNPFARDILAHVMAEVQLQ
jgi:HEAT repeat protein